MKVTPLICVIDDTADYRFLIQQIFSRFYPQYSVKLFPGGDEFLKEILEMKRPSLILLDRHMPSVDGYQLLVTLKEHSVYRSIPVVMMSADATPEEIDNCYWAGVNSFVRKPTDFLALKSSIDTICHYWLNVNAMLETVE